LSALASKNKAWLTIARTMSSRKAFTIRKVGSGRSPVSRLSGIGGDEDDGDVEGLQDIVHGVEAGAAVSQLDVGENQSRLQPVRHFDGFVARARIGRHRMAKILHERLEVEAMIGSSSIIRTMWRVGR